MKRPDTLAVDELEAVVRDLHDTEAALAELKLRIGEVVEKIASEVAQDEVSDAINYLYWNVPELAASQISEAFLGVGHRKQEFRHHIKSVDHDFRCERCDALLPVTSRNKISEYLHILNEKMPRWAEGYFLVCDTCAKEIIAQRNIEYRAEEEAREKRLYELRSMPYREYLLTPEWKVRRAQHLKSAGYRCQVCNSSNKRLNVHHRTYERRGQENYKDLIVLCEECHKLFHQEGKLIYD